MIDQAAIYTVYIVNIWLYNVLLKQQNKKKPKIITLLYELIKIVKCIVFQLHLSAIIHINIYKRYLFTRWGPLTSITKPKTRCGITINKINSNLERRTKIHRFLHYMYTRLHSQNAFSYTKLHCLFIISIWKPHFFLYMRDCSRNSISQNEYAHNRNAAWMHSEQTSA